HQGEIGAASLLRVTPTQLAMLRSWACGTFKADWSGHPFGSESAPTVRALPDAIDRASLESFAGSLSFSNQGTIDSFMPGDIFRLDHHRLKPGEITRSMPCPWHADFLECRSPWRMLRPHEVMTIKTHQDISALDVEIAGLATDGSEDNQRRILSQRRDTLWSTRDPWTRGLPQTSPAREEAFVKEWQHLGFVAPRPDGPSLRSDGSRPFVEVERSLYLGSMGEYFHRLLNMEANRDFAPKALELALQMLDDAKFNVSPKYAPFRYTP